MGFFKSDDHLFAFEDEEYAKVNKLGLWNMKFEYPWQWRKKIRDKN